MRNANKDIITAYGHEVALSFSYNGKSYSNNDIVGAKIYYDAQLFKTSMQCLECTIYDEAEVNGVITNVKATITLDNESTELNFGTFIINEIERDAEMGSYTITAYDLMIKSMVAYEDVITSNTSLANYLQAIATKLGYGTISIVNKASLINANLIVKPNTYKGDSTFRMVLDEIAEATASVICFRNNVLSIVYPSNDHEVIINDDGIISAEIKDSKLIDSVVLSRGDVEDSVYVKDDDEIEEYGLYEIHFDSNQLMDDIDDAKRLQYANAIFNYWNGVTIVEYDMETFGVGIAECGDFINVTMKSSYVERLDDDGEVIEPTEVNYSLLCLSNEIDFSNGLEETFGAELPSTTETDYGIGLTNEQKINQVYVKVDKQNNTITSLVQEVETKAGKDEVGGLVSEELSKLNLGLANLQAGTNRGQDGWSASVNTSKYKTISVSSTTWLKTQAVVFTSGGLVTTDPVANAWRLFLFYSTTHPIASVLLPSKKYFISYDVQGSDGVQDVFLNGICEPNYANKITSNIIRHPTEIRTDENGLEYSHCFLTFETNDYDDSAWSSTWQHLYFGVGEFDTTGKTYKIANVIIGEGWNDMSWTPSIYDFEDSDETIRTSLSEVKQTADSITQIVSTEYTKTGDMELYVKSQVSQTSEKLSIEFDKEIKKQVGDSEGKIGKDISGLGDRVKNNEDVVKQVNTNIQFNSDGMTIGKSDSSVKTQYDNTGMHIKTGNNEVAWATNESFGATEVQVGSYSVSGNRWRIIVSSSGNTLTFTRHN